MHVLNRSLGIGPLPTCEEHHKLRDEYGEHQPTCLPNEQGESTVCLRWSIEAQHYLAADGKIYDAAPDDVDCTALTRLADPSLFRWISISQSIKRIEGIG